MVKMSVDFPNDPALCQRFLSAKAQFVPRPEGERAPSFCSERIISDSIGRPGCLTLGPIDNVWKFGVFRPGVARHISDPNLKPRSERVARFAGLPLGARGPDDYEDSGLKNRKTILMQRLII